MYICGINNIGTIYLLENPSGISLLGGKGLHKSLHTIAWRDTQLKGFTEKNIPFLIHPKHGSIKVKFPEETDVKESISSASGFDYEFDLGLGEKHTNSSQVHCFEATTCEEAVGKMVAWLELFWPKQADALEETKPPKKKKSEKKNCFDAVVTTVQNPSFHRRIEKEGKVFTSNNRVEDATGKYGAKGCWANVAADFAGTIYIGWVATPIPIPHAWLVNDEGNVIERTPNFEGEYVYLGVPIDRNEYMNTYQTLKQGQSVLDAYAKLEKRW